MYTSKQTIQNRTINFPMISPNTNQSRKNSNQIGPKAFFDRFFRKKRSFQQLRICTRINFLIDDLKEFIEEN